MLRYQQQFAFFDMQKVNSVVQFANLTDEALTNDLGKVLEAIVAKIEEVSPEIVIVDSFRTLIPSTSPTGTMPVEEFVQRLAMKLTSWQATTFLIGEYPEAQIRENPLFTIADGLLTMTQRVDRDSMVRQVRVLKMRGNAPQPGLHTVRISNQGIQAFPRMLKPIEEAQTSVTPELISTGVPGLDEMLGGGTLRGNGVLIAGPVGSGKSTVATQFIAEGVKRGEPGVVVIFEETTPKYLDQAKALGCDLCRWMKPSIPLKQPSKGLVRNASSSTRSQDSSISRAEMTSSCSRCRAAALP
jgi:circadian clock protein KaiC